MAATNHPHLSSGFGRDSNIPDGNYIDLNLTRVEPVDGMAAHGVFPPFRKGDVILWHGRLARVGGFMDGRISLHSFSLRNKRLTQNANPNECNRLFSQQIFNRSEQPQFLPLINGVGFLE